MCKNTTHDTTFCRKKNSAKLVSDVTNSADDNNYMFKVTEYASAANIEIDSCDFSLIVVTVVNSLIVMKILTLTSTSLN